MGKYRSDSFGFTPAYAGKIFDRTVEVCTWEVHPRIRGEDGDKGGLRLVGVGSPPHTRGRFLARIVIFDKRRFTPAYAGKIGEPLRLSRCTRVHPRIRGEDSVVRA